MFVSGPGLHRKLWSGLFQVKRRSLNLPGLPGIIIVKIAGRHSLSYPLSFLSRYLVRLVRSLVYLPEYQQLGRIIETISFLLNFIVSCKFKFLNFLVYLFQDQEGRWDSVQLDHHTHKVFWEVVSTHSARLQNIQRRGKCGRRSNSKFQLKYEPIVNESSQLGIMVVDSTLCFQQSAWGSIPLSYQKAHKPLKRNSLGVSERITLWQPIFRWV